MGAWKKRGFSTGKIKKNCRLVQDHGVLGKMYGIRLSETFDMQRNTWSRGEKHVCDDKAPPVAPSAAAKRPRSEEEKKSEKEKKKASQEALRIEKALYR